MSGKRFFSVIMNIILTVGIIIILSKLYGIYKLHDFNGFVKAESNIGTTEFIRDDEITYSYKYSYKLQSDTFNDAIFYKKINVKQNTPYKLTCMVKTKNVISENGKNNAGAQIAIADTVECSESIVGTTEWQKLEFIFDSKNREEIEIGFRLGRKRNKL